MISLKKNQEKRLQDGHTWIYSNEIDVAKTPLNGIAPGSIVCINAHNGKPLGLAYVNPHTLLCARLLTRDCQQTIDEDWISQRLQQALHMRTIFFNQPFYRLVYAESDGLPGLIIDRYGDYLCAQINTAGMEQLQTPLLDALQKLLQPKGILWRNDSNARATEGLPTYIEVASGHIPEHISLLENGAHFNVSLEKGQKTGWFYDHRDNRAWVQKHAAGKRILDLFSYTGSFAIQAAIAGADEVIAVDSSAQAISWLQDNAKLNGVSHKLQTHVSDVNSLLKKLAEAGEQFDLVLLDPPAFIKRRKDIKPGHKAYQRVNELALRVLRKHGMLVSSSCSLHCSSEMLMQAILHSSVATNQCVQIIGQAHQALDHPIHPAIPETNYLKTFFSFKA